MNIDHYDDPDHPRWCRNCLDDLDDEALPPTPCEGVAPKSYCRDCWYDRTNTVVLKGDEGFSYLENRCLDWRQRLVKRERLVDLSEGDEALEYTDWVHVHPRKRPRRSGAPIVIDLSSEVDAQVESSSKTE